MTNTKDTLIQELKIQLQALRQLQTKSPDVLQYLPGDLKLVIKESSTVLKNQNNSSTEQVTKKKKPKNKCAELKANWDKYITEPVHAKANEIINKLKGNSSKSYDEVIKELNDYGKQLFDELDKSQKWFRQYFRGNEKSKDSQLYIRASRALGERKIEGFEDDGTPIEKTPDISGPIDLSKAGDITKVAGISDVIQVKLPKTTKDHIILGGHFDYNLDSRQEPDSFIVRSGSNIIENVPDNVGSYPNKVWFKSIDKPLEIEVIESVPHSVWEVSVSLSFVQLHLTLPQCQEAVDLPCPDISKTPKKKNKPVKTGCYDF